MLGRIREFVARWFSERRSTLGAPQAWLYDALVGATTTSGQSVSEGSAYSLAPYFACIRCISEDVAKLPLRVYRRIGRAKEIATEHPVYSLLHDSPNEEMTAFSFREALTQHALAWGGGYAEIQRDGAGRVRALWPIDPKSVQPKRAQSGRLYYEVRDSTGALRALPLDRVFHVHGLSFDGVTGYSVAAIARESLGGAMAAQVFASAYFGNGLWAGGALKYPGKLSDLAFANLRKSLQSEYGGAKNASKLLILEENAEYVRFGVPPEDAQFLETRQFQTEEICRWFRMPPHKVQHLLRSTFSNIEHQAIEYVSDTLLPWLVRWEQEVNRKLLGDGEHFAEHVVEGLLRGDTQSRYSAYAVAITNGWMSRNEVRALENMNPVEGLDDYLVPLNMSPVGQEPPQEPPTQEGPQDDAAADVARSLLPQIVDAYEAVLRVEYDKLARAAGREDQQKRVEAIYANHTEHVRRRLLPAIDAVVSACCASSRKKIDGCRVASLVDALAAEHVSRSVEDIDLHGIDGIFELWKTRPMSAATDALKRTMEMLSDG